MGLYKAIEAGKEKRRQYKGAKLVDCSCRNHGTCTWCQENRLYRTLRELERTQDEMEDELKDEFVL
jgi:hypothetical protein